MTSRRSTTVSFSAIPQQRANGERKWQDSKFDKHHFVKALRADGDAPIPNALKLTEAAGRACDAAMPRKAEPKNFRRRHIGGMKGSATSLSPCRRVQRARSELITGERKGIVRAPKTAFKQ